MKWEARNIRKIEGDYDIPKWEFDVYLDGTRPRVTHVVWAWESNAYREIKRRLRQTKEEYELTNGITL